MTRLLGAQDQEDVILALELTPGPLDGDLGHTFDSNFNCNLVTTLT